MAAASPLTREQRAAVEWGEGPLMVLAGAGTGKTTVVVQRVRWLLDTDPTLAPENILVLTYNVRAAAELTRRLERALGIERASRLWVHNFHSFGHRLLTTHRAELGLAETGDVLDHIGQVLLLRELRPQTRHFLYHDLAVNPNPTLGRFAEMISRAKDELVTPEDYADFVEAKKRAFAMEFGIDAFDEAIESFRQRKAENRARPIWEVQRRMRDLAVRGGPSASRDELARRDEAARIADREARREAAGTGYVEPMNRLTAEQQDLAAGLKSTFLRDAAALDVLRLQEEAEVYALYQRTLKKRGLVDFGEQQQCAIELLTDYPNLLPALPGPVPPRAGRRVPGRQHRPDRAPRAGRARAGQARQRGRRGGRRPVHLPLPRRVVHRVPRVRAALRPTARLGARPTADPRSPACRCWRTAARPSTSCAPPTGSSPTTPSASRPTRARSTASRSSVAPRPYS